MITRVVLIKLTADSLAERDAFAARSLVVLSALPMVSRVEVGLPADPASAGSWDLLFQVSFADDAALAAYQEDPTHRAFVNGELIGRAAVRKAWNFALL